MKTTRLLTSATILIVITWCSFLSADPRTRILARLDQNGDGMIDQSEFKVPPHRGHNGAGGMLSRADTDNDGNISRDELDSMKTKIKEQAKANLERRVEGLDSMFTAADADNDKLVSPEELRILAFQKTDSNKDGFISVDEMRKPERPIMDQRSRRGGKPHLKHRPDMESE